MPEISIKPEVVFNLFGLDVTNTMIGALLVVAILLLTFGIVARKLKTVPGVVQLFVEEFLTMCRNFVMQVSNNNEKVTKYMFPLFTSFVAFFLLANLLGTFVPFINVITYNNTALYRTATTDYNLILALTLGAFIVMQAAAIISAGILGYAGKFFNFKSPLDFVLGLLDIIGELAKIISLSFRLFGNLFAGEVLLTVVVALIPQFVTVPVVDSVLGGIAAAPFAMLGLLGSVIQALVFPMLILIFVTIASTPENAPEQSESGSSAN